MTADIERAKEVARGDWLHDDDGDIRVMGVIDGYVMVRRPRAIPFVVNLRDLHMGRAMRHPSCGFIRFGRLVAQHIEGGND